MPLTNTRVRNAKPGVKPRKRAKDRESPLPGLTKATNSISGIVAKSAGSDDVSPFEKTTKPCKMADGAGLYLEVDPSGGK